MKTIQTKPDCTLGFVEVEPTWFDFKIIYEDKYHGLWGKDLNKPTGNVYGGEDFYEEWLLIPVILETSRSKDVWLSIIGKFSEITEDQCSKTVKDPIKDGVFMGLDEYYNYSNNDQLCITSALESLKSAALSVGIEEKDFDKYLVIKL